jgi:hypothetical protein
MRQTAILFPVYLQVLLTFAILFRLGPLRVAALRKGEVKLKEVALGQDAWPEHIRQLSRNFENQFEMPVLFYAAVAIALALKAVDGTLVWLAWGFVISRLAHAFVHTSSNSVRLRFNAYLVGVVLLGALWLWLGVSVHRAEL